LLQRVLTMQRLELRLHLLLRLTDEGAREQEAAAEVDELSFRDQLAREGVGVGERQPDVGGELLQGEGLEAALLGGEAQREQRMGESLLAPAHRLDVVLLQALAMGARGAEEDAAAERHHRRDLPDQEAVAGAGDHRLLELELDETLLARRERR